MKTFYVSLVLLLTASNIFADCAGSAMQFFPGPKNTSPDSRFIIEGYGYSQQIVKDLEKHPIYLESDSGEMVLLELCEILPGGMEVTQAILQPVNPLQPNTTYYLEYPNLKTQQKNEMTRRNPETGENEKVYWTTSSSAIPKTAASNIRIRHDKNEYHEYGCGPSAYAVFEVSGTLDGETWFKTEVTELSTGQKTAYYLMPAEGKLYVGHGMCGGPFTFKNSGKYQVCFIPVNPDGTPGKTTKKMTFESPYENSDGLFGS